MLQKTEPTEQAIQDWQHFLKKQNLDLGQEEGYFGPKTQRATMTFQHAAGLKADGIAGPQTYRAAKQRDADFPLPPAAPESRLTLFEIGPDKDDIRECRPYYVVPLLELIPSASKKSYTDTLCERILQTVEDYKLLDAKRPVTDLYVISHGWHRNFFGAIAAYDRLMSRVAALKNRQRLHHPEGKEYRPLYLTLHWNSDPGDDSWMDKQGRRHKASFLTNVRAAFMPKPGTPWTDGDLVNDFEDLFELFSQISAPGAYTLDPKLHSEAQRLLDHLTDRYALRNTKMPDGKEITSRSEKATAAWTCYHEAQPRRVLSDQGEHPGRYNSFPQAAWTLIKFAAGSLGTVALLSQVFQLGRYWKAFFDWLLALPPLAWAWNELTTQPIVIGLWRALLSIGPAFLHLSPWKQVGVALAGCVVALAVCGGTLLGVGLWRQFGNRDKGKRENTIPWLAFLTWLPLQLVCAAPAVLFALLTYLFGGAAARLLGGLLAPLTGSKATIPGLFDERFGRRNQSQGLEGQNRTLYLQYALGWLARLPLSLLKQAISSDSALNNLADTLDNQLAFWKMQQKGAEAGREAAHLIQRLFQKEAALQEARLHFLGHSFGGLVVSNAARHLTLDAPQAAEEGRAAPPTEAPQTGPVLPKLHSLCLLQAAIACSWLEGEETLRQKFQGAIANIYSGYDTANGFYYPLANNGRLAAGYLGLFRIGNGFTPENLGKQGEFASLVTPPVFPPPPDAAQRPRLLNLDASRLIYEGPVATGGGHDDIFKDDVVNLCWAVTTLNITPPAVTRVAAAKVAVAPLLAATPEVEERLKRLPVMPQVSTLALVDPTLLAPTATEETKPARKTQASRKGGHSGSPPQRGGGR